MSDSITPRGSHSLETIYSALRSRRRRYVLYCLRRSSDGVATFDEVRRRVAAWEADPAPDTADGTVPPGVSTPGRDPRRTPQVDDSEDVRPDDGRDRENARPDDGLDRDGERPDDGMGGDTPDVGDVAGGGDPALAESLHHVHVPKLEDCGIIDYDWRTKTLRYRPSDALEAHLDLAVERDLEGTDP